MTGHVKLILTQRRSRRFWEFLLSLFMSRRVLFSVSFSGDNTEEISIAKNGGGNRVLPQGVPPANGEREGDEEAAEGLDLLRKTPVGIMALSPPPNRRISDLLGPNPVRPPTPTGWSCPPKEDSIYVSSSYDPERRLPPMKQEDLTAISIMARFNRITRRLLGGKKKVLFEEPFEEGCKEIL
jgi:hypothetical protein